MAQAPRNAPNGPRARGATAPPDEAPDPAEQPDTTPPLWLDDRAIPVWNAAVDLLTAVRIVAKSDLTALSRYCQLLCEWIELTKSIRERGHTITTKAGETVNPEVRARTQIETALRSLEKALGLDPSSYLDLTRDLSKAATDRQKAKGGRKSVGGFLNTQPRKDGA